MELLKVVKEDNLVKVVLKVGESEHTEIENIKPKLLQLNEIVFNSVEEAEKYFNAVNEHNQKVILDNETRLEQLDENSLEKINDFVDVIKKSKALGKRKAEKIEQLIKAHETMRSFQFNIKNTIEKNKINEQILEEIKKLK